MTYKPREGVDAKTRDGNRAVNVLYDIYTNCKCFSAHVNGRLHYYDKNGFLNNPHSHSSVDLVSDWEETKEEPTMKDEINRRHECNGVKPDLPEGTRFTIWGEKNVYRGLSYQSISWINTTHFLIESYPKAKGWVNVYKKPNGVVTTSIVRKTKELADKSSGKNRIDCVEIEYTP